MGNVGISLDMKVRKGLSDNVNCNLKFKGRGISVAQIRVKNIPERSGMCEVHGVKEGRSFAKAATVRGEWRGKLHYKGLVSHVQVFYVQCNEKPLKRIREEISTNLF